MLQFAKKAALAAAAAAVAITAHTAPANAGQNPYIGETMLVGFNFCPRGWAAAAGQLMPIAQYQALFSLLGTQYGGDGRTTFALPDLRGRAPVSQGRGPGLSTVTMGQRAGAEAATLSSANLPPHSHAATATSTLNATGTAADAGAPAGNVLARTGSTAIYNAGPAAVPMGDSAVSTTVTVAPAGGGQAFSIRNPYLGMQWCIALQGIFPPRS